MSQSFQRQTVFFTIQLLFKCVQEFHIRKYEEFPATEIPIWPNENSPVAKDHIWIKRVP